MLNIEYGRPNPLFRRETQLQPVATSNGFHTEEMVAIENATALPEFIDERGIVPHDVFLNMKYGDIHLSTTENTGDMAGRDHNIVIGMINNTAEIYAEAKRQEYAMYGEDSKLARDVRFFKNQEIDFHAYVKSENERLKDDADWVMLKYAIADEIATQEIAAEGLEGNAAMVRRAAHRILAVQPEELTENENPMVEIVSDFDLTMSKGEDTRGEYRKDGKEDARVYLEPNIPSSAPAEKHIEHSRDDFAIIFAQYWNDFLGEVPHLFEEGGRNGRVPLRDGVREFFTYVKDKNWDINIVSANFGRFAHQALAGIPDVDRAGFLAIWHNDIRSTMKDIILHYMAIRNKHSADVFIGDGSSDKPALNAHATTAVYFALDGYGFSKELAQQNVCQFTYKDFNDIMATMDAINEECAMIRNR